MYVYTVSSTPEPTLASMSFTTTSSLMSDQPDQLSPVSGDSKYQLGIQGGGGGVFDSSAAAKLKLKTSRGLSSEQKEVCRLSIHVRSKICFTLLLVSPSYQLYIDGILHVV